MHTKLSAAEAEAFDHANRAIGLSADQRHADALLCWQKAASIARTASFDKSLAQWIDFGHGAALEATGAYQQALTITGSTLETAPAPPPILALLTMARAHLALGNLEIATPFLREINQRVPGSLHDLFDERHHTTIEAVLGAVK